LRWKKEIGRGGAENKKAGFNNPAFQESKKLT